MEKAKQGKWIFLGLIIVLAVLIYALPATMGDDSVVIYDDLYSSGEANIAIVDIVGTISEDDGDTYNQQWVLDSIQNAFWDQDNRAILLYIDTPGGSVYESDEVYLALQEYKAYTGRPVYAYMAAQATSGGYYIAAAADEIYANRNTITGSIGVVFGQSIDLTEFMERYGIRMTTVTAGKNKNMFSIDEPVTAEHLAIMQALADESYDQFVQIVAESRSMTIAQVEQLADGRIYSAKQALKNGLIDGVMGYDDYLYQVKTAVRATTVIRNDYEAETSLLYDWLSLSYRDFRSRYARYTDRSTFTMRCTKGLAFFSR